MLQSVWGVVHEGKIQPTESVVLPEGAKVLLTLLPEDEVEFWKHVSEKSLGAIWSNVEDDVYGQLLQE